MPQPSDREMQEERRRMEFERRTNTDTKIWVDIELRCPECGQGRTTLRRIEKGECPPAITFAECRHDAIVESISAEDGVLTVKLEGGYEYTCRPGVC